MAHQHQPAQQSHQQYYPPPDPQKHLVQTQYVQPQGSVDQLAGNISTMSISSLPQTSAGASTAIVAPPTSEYIHNQTQVSAPPMQTHPQAYTQPQPQSLPIHVQYQAAGRQYDPRQFSQNQTFASPTQYQHPSAGEQFYPNVQQTQSQPVQNYSPQYQQPRVQQEIVHQNTSYNHPGLCPQPRNPSARRPVPGTQLQNKTPVVTHESSQTSLQLGYPSPPDTPNPKNVQRQAPQIMYQPPNHSVHPSPPITAPSVSYSPQPGSSYSQNGTQTPVSAIGSPAPPYQQPHAVHVLNPTFSNHNAAANSTYLSSHQVEQQPRTQYFQNQNQSTPPVQQAPTPTYLPSVQSSAQQFGGQQQQHQQQPTSMMYSQAQPHPSYAQPANPQIAYAPPTTNFAPNNHYQQQSFHQQAPVQNRSYVDPRPPIDHQSYAPPPSSTHTRTGLPSSSTPPMFSAQSSIGNLYTRSKPAAEKVGSALGKGYKRTSKFLTSSNGKKVMAGTAGLLVAGFIGAEVGDMMGGTGGAEALAGGGGADALVSGGDSGATDLQASQAYHDMAQQGQINSMSLIDDTQYELVPASQGLV